MSSTQTDTTPVQKALASLELPSLDGLTEDQVRGITCVWDGGEKLLTDADAITLGPRRKGRLDGEYDWHPRGCPEHVAKAAYEGLFRHCMGDCEACARADVPKRDGAAQETSCEVGVALRRLVIRKGRL